MEQLASSYVRDAVQQRAELFERGAGLEERRRGSCSREFNELVLSEGKGVDAIEEGFVRRLDRRSACHSFRSLCTRELTLRSPVFAWHTAKSSHRL